LQTRGREIPQGKLFYGLELEIFVPAEHPLRRIRALTDAVLELLSPKLDPFYADQGAPSVPPKRLPRALLLQKLYTLRSERQLEEQLRYNFLDRWFFGPHSGLA
jgi:transposase